MIRRALAWLAVALAAIAAVWATARRNAVLRGQNKALQGYIETRKDMDDADSAMGDDPDVLRDSLRARDRNQR